MGGEHKNDRFVGLSSACRRREVGVEKGGEALEIKEKLSSQT